MKRMSLLGVAVSLLVFARFAVADISESQRTESDPWSIIAVTNNTTGTYTYTNTVDHPWWMASAWYYTPVAVLSNVWSVSHISKYAQDLYSGDVITTNDWGVVETNNYHQVTNVVYVYNTNALVAQLISTTTPIVKSVNDLAVPISQYVYVRPGDLLIFEWSRSPYSWTGTVHFGWAGRK